MCTKKVASPFPAPPKSMQWNFSQRTDTCCSSQQAAGDKGAKANAYQIILNASRETEKRGIKRERERESAEQEDCSLSRVDAQIFICKTAKQILAAAKCTLPTWQLGKQMNSNWELCCQIQSTTHTHTHTRVQVATAFVLQATAISATVANSGAFLLFILLQVFSNFIGEAFGWQLAQLIPLPPSPCSTDNVIACRTKPACI